MSTPTYWLYNWLDEHGATTVDAAQSLLKEQRVVEDLRERATQAKEPLHAPVQGDMPILAGRGLDLSGQLDCNGASCRKRQVDELFRHVWHYFDRIVVADGVAHEVSMHWGEDTESVREWLLSHIRVILYVRELGAERLVTFREKPPPCEKHLGKHAKDAGLEQVLAYGMELIPVLANEAKIHLKRQSSGEVAFALSHPDFEHTVYGLLEKEKIESRSSLELAASEEVVHRYIANLTSDVAASQHTKVPLGANITFHGRLLQQSKELTSASVAFQLQLPVIHGIPTETLIKIRRDEHEHFERFQNRLRQAIEERIKLDPSSDATKIAEQIRQDLIEPELRKIRDKLEASVNLLEKKSMIGVALGALATVCGIIGGLPPTILIPGAITPILTMYGQAESKHLEETRDVALEDMYFLWKAVQHQPHIS